MMAGKSYFERNEDGEPVNFVQYHDSHPHNGERPHEHVVDLKEATIESISQGGNFNDLRQDR